MSEPQDLSSEIQLLRIRIAALRRERDDLRARANHGGAREATERLALRLATVALWLVGAVSTLVLLLYVLLMTGIFRMGPG